MALVVAGGSAGLEYYSLHLSFPRKLWEPIISDTLSWCLIVCPLLARFPSVSGTSAEAVKDSIRRCK